MADRRPTADGCERQFAATGGGGIGCLEHRNTEPGPGNPKSGQETSGSGLETAVHTAVELVGERAEVVGLAVLRVPTLVGVVCSRIPGEEVGRNKGWEWL